MHTLETDRTVKKDKYAQAGIPEYWIVIPAKGIIEVYRQPEDGVYLEKMTYRQAEEWTFKAFDLVVKGQKYRRGGFNTPEEAALARDCVIRANLLPNKRSFSDDHFDYYVDKYGFYELKIEV